MRKIGIVVILTLFCAVLWGDFVIEQELIDSLNVKALRNISQLPREIEARYASYLTKYPDGIMAFMIASEADSKLWVSEPQVTLDNYKYVKKLMKMEDYEKYSDRFVLSYIIKTTVSHEKLTNYRKVFAKEKLLKYVKRFPDLNDRIREINLWCRENMMFVSTSGRSQDPISILKKSNIGRCGEMQVFFIAACRTIGIPTRPARTPWWANTDNNHAWTEVYVDDAWHYVENAQPDYYLDSTWFSGAVTKSLLVLARSAFPDSLDDVVVRGINESSVNSTRFYQATRQVSFSMIDEEGKGVDGTGLNIFAFNFSMLRPLLTLRGDSLGNASVDISRGGFLAIAYKDSLYDFVVVPYGTEPIEYTLILKDRVWENEDFTFRFPDATGMRRDDPELFAKRKKEAETTYNDMLKEIQSKKIPNYAPQNDSVFVEIYQQSRNNKEPLLDFIKENKLIEADFWVKVSDIDVKFLWQATTLQWQNIYRTYQDLREAGISEELFPNLLSPSVYYETLPTVRVADKFLLGKGAPSLERVKSIIDTLHSNFIVDRSKAPQSLLPLDRLQEGKYFRDLHFKTLSCYVLKANNIPASYSRIPSTILVKVDSVWKNYNVIDNEYYSPQVKKIEIEPKLIDVELMLVDKAGLPVPINSDNIATTFFKHGRFYPNDRQLSYDKELNTISGELEQGNYQVQIGVRESGEVTKVKLVSLKLDEQLEYKQILTFNDFKREWKNVDKKYLEFINNFKGDTQKSCIVLLGDYDNEPVQRLATKTRQKLSNEKFIWVGENSPLSAMENYVVSAGYKEFLDENPELKHRLITFYYDFEKSEWKMFEGNWDLLYK